MNIREATHRGVKPEIARARQWHLDMRPECHSTLNNATRHRWGIIDPTVAPGPGLLYACPSSRNRSHINVSLRAYIKSVQTRQS